MVGSLGRWGAMEERIQLSHSESDSMEEPPPLPDSFYQLPCLKGTIVGRSLFSHRLLRDYLVNEWGPLGLNEIAAANSNSFIANFYDDSSCIEVRSKGPWFYKRHIIHLQRCLPRSAEVNPEDECVQFWVRVLYVPKDFFNISCISAGVSVFGRTLQVQLAPDCLHYPSNVARVKILFNLENHVRPSIRLRNSQGAIAQVPVNFELYFVCERCGRVDYMLNLCPGAFLCNHEPTDQNEVELIRTHPTRICQPLHVLVCNPDLNPRPTGLFEGHNFSGIEREVRKERREAREEIVAHEPVDVSLPERITHLQPIPHHASGPNEAGCLCWFLLIDGTLGLDLHSNIFCIF